MTKDPDTQTKSINHEKIQTAGWEQKSNYTMDNKMEKSKGTQEGRLSLRRMS